MGPIRCPETSVKDYHSTLRNIQEDRRSHHHRGGSLKSRIIHALALSNAHFYVISNKVAHAQDLYIQDIHKRMVRFQKLTRNLFLTLDGHNVHRQQRQLSTFLMR
jgi:hypothetical protein